LFVPQGGCEYVLARECEVSDVSFEVQVRNTARLPGQVCYLVRGRLNVRE
jgi:hypothetical protein